MAKFCFRVPVVVEDSCAQQTACNPAAAHGKLLEQNQNWEQAEQVYTEMLANGVNPVAALTGLGDAHAAQRDWAPAAVDYRQAAARTADPARLRELQRKFPDAERRR